mmetsp:Transcript_90594/g.261025  ORF Transcript_90594/g.261025 Transcript_90594/m.261025 type:complete len:257 (+) Transcript_90594:481-1251(+)
MLSNGCARGGAIGGGDAAKHPFGHVRTGASPAAVADALAAPAPAAALRGRRRGGLRRRRVLCSHADFAAARWRRLEDIGWLQVAFSSSRPGQRAFRFASCVGSAAAVRGILRQPLGGCCCRPGRRARPQSVLDRDSDVRPQSSGSFFASQPQPGDLPPLAFSDSEVAVAPGCAIRCGRTDGRSVSLLGGERLVGGACAAHVGEGGAAQPKRLAAGGAACDLRRHRSRPAAPGSLAGAATARGGTSVAPLPPCLFGL